MGRVLAVLRAQRQARRHGLTLGRRVKLGPKVNLRAHHGASIVIGDRVEIGGYTTVVAQAGAHVIIDDDVFISGFCIIAAIESVTIGRDSMLAEMVCIRDHDHDPDLPPKSGAALSAPVHIGARVWLGSKSSVLRGGRVGDDSVVGAHALVRDHIPSGVLAVGLPARVARPRGEPAPPVAVAAADDEP